MGDQRASDLANRAESLAVFSIFEGGGAKGITHIGALKAMEKVGLVPIGVAGASAGAIVAVLIAAGFFADEIYDPAGSDILRSRGKGPVDFLGRADWALIDYGRRVAGSSPRLLLILALLSPLLLLLLFAAPVALHLARGARAPLRLVRRLGLLSNEAFADLVNEILRERLAPIYEQSGEPLPALVTFAHLAPRDPVAFPAFARLIHLKIAVTDLATQSLIVLDHSEHPNAVIGDAVAASSAIPLIFQPARIRGLSADDDRRYVDGGLISNLPSWAFQAEKRRNERDAFDNAPIPIVAFTLEEAGALQRWRAATLLKLIARVARAGIFGSQEVVQAFVPDLIVMPIQSSLGLLAFDCTRADADRAYREGLTVEARLQLALRERPAEARRELGRLLAELPEAPGWSTAYAGVHRASLVRRTRSKGFRVVASAGAEADADDRLTLDPRAPGAPQAWVSRDLDFVDLSRLDRQARHMTRQELALVRPTLRSIIAVPILEPAAWERAKADRLADPRGVVCIDSDNDLAPLYDLPAFRQWLVARSLSFASLMEDLDDRPEL